MTVTPQPCHEVSAGCLLTKGRNELRVSVIEYVSWTTGVNCSIFGYMSSGESVPDVMTTVLNRSNTGLIAIAGSRQLVNASVKTKNEASVWRMPGRYIRKMENGVGDRGIVRLERLEDEQEACDRETSLSCR